MRVQFINAAKVNVQTIECRAFGGEGFELGARLQDMDVVGPHRDAEAAAKPGRLPGHRLRVAKHYPRLITSRSQRIDLRASFAIGSQHVQRQRRRNCRFGIPARDFYERPSEPPLAVRLDPPEHGGEDKHLPGLQVDRLSGQRPLHMRQALDERAQVVGGRERLARLVGELWVEPVSTARPLEALQVIQLALTGLARPFAGRNSARHHVPGVLARNSGIVAWCHQPAMSDQGSLSRGVSPGAEIRERAAGVNPISVS